MLHSTLLLNILLKINLVTYNVDSKQSIPFKEQLPRQGITYSPEKETEEDIKTETLSKNISQEEIEEWSDSRFKELNNVDYFYNKKYI